MRLFLAADRSLSEANAHLTPLVWAEKVTANGFEACVHFQSDFATQAQYWKEGLRVAWWAIDTAGGADTDRRFLGRIWVTLERNESVCVPLAEEVNPHSHTVLASTSHPGIRYEQYYYGGAAHTARETAISWIEERAEDRFAVCAKRVYEKTEGVIEDAAIDVLSLARNKRYSGLASVRLGEYGRGCAFVDADLTKVGAADDGTRGLPRVFVQARMHREDRGRSGQGPRVVAWVEKRIGRGFTVCAKNVARGRREAKRSVAVHWVAVHRVGVGMDRSVCRDGVVV